MNKKYFILGGISLVLFSTAVFAILLYPTEFVQKSSFLSNNPIFGRVLAQEEIIEDFSYEDMSRPRNITEDFQEFDDEDDYWEEINEQEIIEYDFDNLNLSHRDLNSDVYKINETTFVAKTFSKSINMLDLEGEYQPYEDVTNFYFDESNLILKWNDKKVILEIFVEENGNPEKIFLKNTTTQKRVGLSLTTEINQSRGAYYYDHRLNAGNIKKVGYKIITENVTCYQEDLRLICDEQMIDFSEAFYEQNLSVTFGEKENKGMGIMSLGESSKNEIGFIDFEGEDLSYIDPTVTINENDGHEVGLIMSGSQYFVERAPTKIYVEDTSDLRSYGIIDFQIYHSTVPSYATVTSTIFHYRTRGDGRLRFFDYYSGTDDTRDEHWDCGLNDECLFWDVQGASGRTCNTHTVGSSGWKSIEINSGNCYNQARAISSTQSRVFKVGMRQLYDDYTRIDFATSSYSYAPYIVVTYSLPAPVTSHSATSPPGGASYSSGTWTKNNVRNTLSCVSDCTNVYYCTDTANSCTPNTNLGSSGNVEISTQGTSYIRWRGYSSTTTEYETTKSFTMRIDKTDPSVSITSPDSDGQVFLENINIGWSASDTHSGLSSCTYSKNGASQVGVSCGSTLTGQSWLQGSNTITFYANDAVGNTGSATRQFSVYTEGLINIVSPAQNQIFTNESPHASLEIETLLDMDTCYYNNGSTNYSMTKTNSTYFHTNAGPTLLDGAHTISFFCNQTSDGTWRESDSVSFEIDPINITTCRNLNMNNRIYNLQNNLNSAGDCLEIKGNNITLGGNYRTITGPGSSPSAIGIKVTGQNSTIQDVTINSFTTRIQYSSSNYNVLKDSTFGGFSATTHRIIDYVNSNNNEINNVSVSGNSGTNFYGIYLSESSNNEVEDYVSSSNTGTSNRYDVYATSNSRNNIFLSSDFSYEYTSATSNFSRQWYFDTQVNDSLGNPIDLAVVKIWDSESRLIYDGVTFATGRAAQQKLVEYNHHQGSKVTTTPHLVNVSKSTYITNSSSINVNNDYFHEVNLFNEDSSSPSITIHSPLSESTNSLIQLINITANDDYGVDKIWYNWNGTNLTYSIPINTEFNEGIINLFVYANDTSGNDNFTNVSFTIDTLSPNVTMTPESKTIMFGEEFGDAIATSASKSSFESFSYTVSASNEEDFEMTLGGSGGCGAPVGGERTTTCSHTYYFSWVEQLSVGTYTNTINYTDSFGNSAWKTFELNITQDDGSCDVLFDETSPLTYPNTFRVYSNCDTPFTLKRNGTEISNNSIQSLGAGIYNFSVQRTDTQNYSNVYDEELFTLNKATTSLSVSGTSPINYGTAGDVQGTGCPAQLSCNLYREGTLVSNPDTTILNAGIYNYIYNTTGNENYTSDSDNFELTVIEIDAGCSIQFNKDSPLIYPDTFNVWHTCSIPATIYRNGSVVSNNSLQSLGAGTYNFSVTADEPGSYINTSDEKLFTINRKNSQLSLVFDKSSPQTYGGTITPTCSVIHGENTPILRLDGGIITSGNPLLLGAGNYNFSCSLTESQNYTSSLNESSFTINKAVPDMVAYLNGVINSISINYPSTVNASASTNAGTLGMWRNGTNVLGENNLGVLLGSGYYSYKFNVTGNENYTDVSDVYLYANVGKSSSPCNVLFNESSPKIVGNVFEVYSNCDSPFTLRRGETNVENNSVQDLAIGVYTFNVNRTDTQNYSNVYDSKNFEITDKLIPEINLTFDKVSPQTYGTEINVSCTTNSDGVLTLTRNGIDVTGELNTFVLLGADSHTYICSVTETATYNSNQQQSIFGINRATSGVYTYLNNSRSNLEINEGTGIWLNGTLETGIGSIKLYNNGILINQGISPLSNLTLFSTVGVYNITTIYEETQNYSSSYESFNVTVKDISLPEVTINSPQNISYSNKNILLDISSSDNIEVYSVWYNWEGTNQTYFSPQTIEFNEGSNTLFAYANDTSGNENFTSVTFFVDTIAPSINILYPEATNYGNTAFDLNYSVYDAGVGVHSCWFKIVGSTRGIIVNNQTLDGCTNSTFNVPGGDTYTLTLYSNDTLNNLNSESVVFGVNLESPFIELNNPSDNKYLNYKENILFNFTVTDGDGIGTCELWGDWNGWHKNQTLNSVSSGVQTSFGLINLNDGNYKWNVWCNDSLGNGDFSLNNFTLTIDTVYPLFGFGIGTEENYANKSQSNIYINTTWTEINFKNITFRANSNTQSFSTPTYYHNFVGLGNGVYTYNVTICDLADNCNSTGNRIITLDTINPNVTLMSPANETVTNIPEQNLTANMTDANLKNITLEIYNESGILINQTDIDTGSSGVIGIVYTFSEGVFSWLYKAWDWAGNLFTSEKRTITVDLTSPGITIVSPTNTTYSNSTQLLSISTSDNFVVESILYNWKGTNYTYTGPTNIILTAGSNHLIVYANDTAGNTNSSELYSSLDYEDDIEIVFFKTSSTPELGETINLQVETKTNNLNITSCNFSLVSPTKNIFINELGISDNNLFNEVWTSTSSYLINETGTYTFNVTCVNEMGGYFSSFSTFAIDYNLTYSPLNYSFASRVSPTEQNNITIYMYDNSNSSIIYDISMNVTNQSNFTLNYPSTITLNDLDSSLNQYTFSTSIAGKEGISNGTYFGNISLTNRVSGEITIIPFVYGIRPPSGIPQIRTTLDSPCNRTSGNCDNTVLSLTQGSSTTLNYKVTNIGLYNLSSCNVMMSNSLEQGWATSAPSSFSLEQLTSREISITLFPTTSVQAKTYEGFIYVYCGSGDALGSAIESEVSNRPYLRLQVLTSTAPPSGGGGGGGGGGGIDLESPEKVPPKVEDIVGICGNAICEPDFGENPQNCPQDCKIDYTGLTACFSSDPKIREECILFKGTSLFYIFTFIVLVILFTLFFTQDKKKRTITKIKFGRRKR